MRTPRGENVAAAGKRRPYLRLVRAAPAFHNPAVKTVCAASVLFGREAFGTLGETVVLPDRVIGHEHLRDADALIVRSKTRVDAALLKGTRVHFVGTATAGTDHLDTEFLNEADLAWCAAPGCNANSVAEYVATSLLYLAQRHGLELAGRTLGVIGVGEIGSRVVRKAEALGMRVLKNDPPLRLATGDKTFLELDDVLREADVLTLHVPLAERGPYPTLRLANCHFFEHARAGCVFVNTSRGEVMDSEGLLFALEQGAVSHAVLDVWEHEPFVSRDLLAKVDLGTPHIAGYSFEGRLNGTLQVYREACHYFEVEPSWNPDESAFAAPPQITCDLAGKSGEQALADIVLRAYDIRADDIALRSGPAEHAGWGIHFDSLRRTYPDRREFAAARLQLSRAGADVRRKLGGIGFSL